METLLNLMKIPMPIPSLYGWYHFLWLGITVAATVVLCKVFKNADDRVVQRIVFFTALIVVALEVYKQVLYTFTYRDGQLIADYQWIFFPFQFCSTPMYVGLLAGVLKKGRVRDSLYAYLATYGFFAGICVMVYPADVFTPYIGINVQTMICHGSMIMIGVFLMVRGQVAMHYSTVLKALPVFVVGVGGAVVMNEIAYRVGIVPNEVFNMFYVSPYCTPTLPVYSLVQHVVPFPWCLFIYIAGFTLAAALVLSAGMLCQKLFSKKA